MDNNPKRNAIDGPTIEVLNALADFAEFNEIGFQWVLPNPDSSWWRVSTQREASVVIDIEREQFDSLSDTFSDRRRRASSPGIHLILPEDLDTIENRETLLYGAKAWLYANTRMQVVTLGSDSRSVAWERGRGSYPKGEFVELYAPNFEIRATKLEVFVPDPALASGEWNVVVNSVRGATSFMHRRPD